MEKYAHWLWKKKIFGEGGKWVAGWVGKCSFQHENKKNTCGKVQNCPQNIHNLEKLQWKIKKFGEKLRGYLVNKLESYQHFVCG